MFAEMDAGGLALVITAAVGSIGAIVLQVVQMILSYLRDSAIKTDVGAVKADTTVVVKATNGMTEKLVAAELTAERMVNKAEVKAVALINTAAIAADNLTNKANSEQVHLRAEIVAIKQDFRTTWNGIISRGFTEAKSGKHICPIPGKDAYDVSPASRTAYMAIASRLRDINIELTARSGKPPDDYELSWAIENEFQTWMADNACKELQVNQHGCLAIACIIARETY